MSQNALNLAVRFLLELAALYAFGRWGWNQRADFMRYVLMIGLPLIAATLWGVFRVPGDASANGNAPVAVRAGYDCYSRSHSFRSQLFVFSIRGCVMQAGSLAQLPCFTTSFRMIEFSGY
jgi:hypothetical protein